MKGLRTIIAAAIAPKDTAVISIDCLMTIERNTLEDIKKYMRSLNGEEPSVWCDKVWNYVNNKIEDNERKY